MLNKININFVWKDKQVITEDTQKILQKVYKKCKYILLYTIEVYRKSEQISILLA